LDHAAEAWAELRRQPNEIHIRHKGVDLCLKVL
jgi:hypothetical protein